MKKDKFYVINVFLVMILITLSLAGCSGKKSGIDTTELTTAAKVSEGKVNSSDTVVSESQVQNQAMDSCITGSKSDSNTGYTTDREEAIFQLDEYGLGTWTGENYNFPNYSTEEYKTIVENDFVSVLNNPLSTFSVDVDTASYSNIM